MSYRDTIMAKAREVSPKHTHAFNTALADIEPDDIAALAVATKGVCYPCNIGEFPNPFAGDVEDGKPRKAWAEAFGKLDPKPDFNRLDKPALVGHLLDEFGIQFTTRERNRYSRDDVEAIAERAWRDRMRG